MSRLGRRSWRLKELRLARRSSPTSDQDRSLGSGVTAGRAVRSLLGLR